MLKFIYFILLTLLLASCQNEAEYESKQFDVRKDYNKAASVDLVIFSGYTKYDEFGGNLEGYNFTVGGAYAKIAKTFKDYKWNPESLNELISKHDPELKKDTGCLCRPTYVCAFVVYTSDEDPFGNLQKEKAAIVMLDESHDSILVSDRKNGIKYYRLSDGHSSKKAVPVYLSGLLKSVGMIYKFRDRDR